MKRMLTILVAITLLSGCTSWKNLLINGEVEKSAIYNAVLDFVNTSPLSKLDSTFMVSIREQDQAVVCISITGTLNKFYIVNSGKSSKLPTDYLEYSNKLFYWNKEGVLNTESINQVLTKYKLLDTVPSIGMIEFINDDSKKGVDYYFCKQNLIRYKKVKTSEAVGYYPPPKNICPND